MRLTYLQLRLFLTREAASVLKALETVREFLLVSRSEEELGRAVGSSSWFGSRVEGTLSDDGREFMELGESGFNSRKLDERRPSEDEEPTNCSGSSSAKVL